MILDIFTITLDPATMSGSTVQEMNRFFSAALSEYIKERKTEGKPDQSPFLTRYPAVIAREIKGRIRVTGINEGAQYLTVSAGEDREFFPGHETWRISRDYKEPGTQYTFGPSDTMIDYEFVTPWAGLTQENYRKFYTLKGKTERDEFVAKILAGSVRSLARALDAGETGSLACTTNLHFQKTKIDGENTIVFTGKFRMDFCIPDFLALGKFVGRGYGAVTKSEAAS